MVGGMVWTRPDENYAREIMQPFLVGTLKDAQQYVRPKAVRVVSQKTEEATTSSSSMSGCEP